MDSTTSNLQSKSSRSEPSWWRKHGQKLLVLGVWLLILGGYWGYTSQNNLSPLQAGRYLANFLHDSAFGPLIFLAVYLIRSLILFPTSVMTILAGFLFGPIWGSIYAISGNLISGMVAYVVGHYFGEGLLASNKEQNLVDRYADYLRQNSFEAVLVMRLILLNYDAVSYLAGLLRINWKTYLVATGLGSVAGAVSYVLAGASIEGEFAGTWPRLDPWLLGVAAALFIASFAIAWYLRRTRKTKAQS